jgi:hypothetical protein
MDNFMKLQCIKLLFVVILFIDNVSARAQLGKIFLNSQSTDWRIKPQTEVGGDSVRLFQPGYNTESWVKAIVPGAVFTSYVNAGVEKDPNYGDNIYKVDQSKYNRNFWYLHW